jgi:excisionase family DNA binding protein
MAKLFTTEDASKYLGVSASRVRQFILENRLKSVKVGRDHLIEDSALRTFAEQGQKKRGRPEKKKLLRKR